MVLIVNRSGNKKNNRNSKNNDNIIVAIIILIIIIMIIRIIVATAGFSYNGRSSVTFYEPQHRAAKKITSRSSRAVMKNHSVMKRRGSCL